jgi:hypothetical protein
MGTIVETNKTTLVVDPKKALDALFEIVTLRRRGASVVVDLRIDDPIVAFARTAANRILASSDHEERVEHFEALEKGRLLLDGKPQAELTGIEPRVLATLRDVLKLAAGVVVRSWTEYERITRLFGVQIPVCAPAFVDFAVPAFERDTKPDAAVVWGPALDADEVALQAFALEDLHLPIFVVARRGEVRGIRAQFVPIARAGEALARARVVVDATTLHPGNAIALAACKIPLIVASTSGAHEFLAGVGTYELAQRAAVVRAVQSALAAEPPVLISSSFASDMPKAATPTQDGPLVSVIVRTYKRHELLMEALECVDGQTYANVEAVVVNETDDDVSAIVARFHRARLATQPPGRGFAGASNWGIEAAAGEFMMLLDDDDLIFPEHVARLVGALQRSGADVASANTVIAFYERNPAAGDPYGFSVLLDGVGEPTDFHVNDKLGPMAVLFRRGTARSIGGFDAEMPHADDWDFWLRLAQHCDFVHVDAVTGVYRVQGDRSGLTLSRGADLAEAMSRMAKKFPLEDRPLVVSARDQLLQRFVSMGMQARFPEPALRR